MDTTTTNFELIKKKNTEYYSFLRAARKQICKELTISSEDDGPLALIHPDIGFKLYGVFEHGKEKTTYEVCNHYFSKDNCFQSQVTKISNRETNVEKHTFKGKDYYCLGKDTFLYKSKFNGKEYLNIRVIKNNFTIFSRKGISFGNYEVEELKNVLNDINDTVLSFIDGDNVQFHIGFFKQIQYDTDKKQLEFYKTENDKRIPDSGITLCGEAVRNFFDYMQLAAATNEIEEKETKTTVSPSELFKAAAAADPEAKKKRKNESKKN